MIRGIKPLPQTLIFYSLYSFGHSGMPCPLAPDPIRVRSCVCCHSEPIAIVWRYHLSFYLSHYPIRVMNSSIDAINKWKYLLLLKLYCGTQCCKSWIFQTMNSGRSKNMFEISKGYTIRLQRYRDKNIWEYLWQKLSSFG